MCVHKTYLRWSFSSHDRWSKRRFFPRAIISSDESSIHNGIPFLFGMVTYFGTVIKIGVPVDIFIICFVCVFYGLEWTIDWINRRYSKSEILDFTRNTQKKKKTKKEAKNYQIKYIWQWLIMLTGVSLIVIIKKNSEFKKIWRKLKRILS